MRRALRRLGRGAAALLLLLAVAGAGGWLWLRTSLPQLDGSIAVPGLAAPVTIARDGHGIPYIKAASERDALFALGFVHAQDRLAQMELTRRLGTGRLSELAGESTLGLDRTMRTLGIGRLAQGDLDSLPLPVREALDAYTAGVNGFLETRRGALPPEFWLLWHAPEPWTPADSLLWGRLMALRLTDNWGTELLRARLAERLPPERVAALWPEDPPGAPVSIEAADLASRADNAPAGSLRLQGLGAGPFLPDGMPSGADGSNAWAISGRLTASGKPILANDPHLGHSLPNHWYLARIDAPGLTLAGATAPGVPFLILGHNGRLAWGLTTTHGDASDLFLERVAERQPGHYQAPGGPLPFEVRNETIAVRWGADLSLTVRATRHGPVVSDLHTGAAAAPPGHVLALAHTGLSEGDINAAALYGAGHATDLAQFREALRMLRAPQQNVLAADGSGAIAIDMPALIPIRRSGQGLQPAEGWSGARDWTDFVPFPARPQAADPARGWIANANNRLVSEAYPYFIARSWPEPYRAMRITESLTVAGGLRPEDAARLQQDATSLGAGAALEALLRAEPRSGRAAQAIARLRAWDLRMDRDRPEPLIYAAWMREAMRTVYADELGPVFPDWWSDRPLPLQRTVAQDPSWCDDVTTPEPEDCPERLGVALEAALDRLERDHGPNPAGWRWGDAHQARFDHMLFGRIPYLRDLLRLRIASDGGNFTVNRGGFAIGREDAPFEQIHGPGFRAVYDLADLDESLFIQSVGQSGNPFSPHFADLMPLWRDGRYVRLAPPARPAHLLRLEPAEARP